MITEPSEVAVGAASGVPAVWGHVPQRNKNFTGRVGLLRELREHLTKDSTTTAVLQHALHGLGGVGKTQLAMEYAYRFQGEYEVVWWVSADQPSLIRSTLAALAPRLQLPAAGRTDEAVAAVLDALRRGEPYSSWLLVFDNADQPETLQDFMPPGPGHVLITSRNHRWEGTVDTIEIDVFSRAESLEFLLRRVPGIEEPDADRLADELGDLPLALEQAGALQAESGMPVQDYLTLFAKQAGQLLAENPPVGYHLPVAAAWSVSMAKVGEAMPMALEVLRRCAFFGPEPFSRDLLTYGKFVLDPPLREFLANPIQFSRAIRELGRYALARIDNNRKTLQVHRLIQKLIRDELGEDKATTMRHDVHRLLTAADPGDPTDTSSWPVYASLYPHIGPSDVVSAPEPEVRRFVQNIVYFLFQSGDYEAALSEADRAIEAWAVDSTPDDPDILIVSGHKADALWALGRFEEAYELRRVTLDRMRIRLGADHEETLKVLNGHGSDLRARGDFVGARALDEESLELHRRVYGDHYRTFAAANNLAIDYGLTSDYAKALELNEKNYTNRRVFYGGDDHRMVAWSLNAWARDMRHAGQYLRARETAEKAYELFQELVDRNDIDEFHSLVLLQAKDLSVNRRKAGAFPEAFELADEIYKKYQKVFATNHPDRLAAGINLGNAMRAMKQIQAAVERIERTVQRYTGALGPDHPYTHGSALNLALVRRQQGDVAEARRLLEEALQGLTASLGTDHHYTLTCATNLATAISELGDPRRGMELGRDTLRRFRTVLGPNHPHTLVCATNLALDLRTLGKDEEGKKLADETIERYRRVLFDDHPDVAAAVRGERLDFDFEPPPF